jgi:putative SOS response-associated peptidase YedK
MCGRFVLMAAGKLLAEHFQLNHEPSIEPRHNIAPSQLVAVVRLEPGSTIRELQMLRWGLIPFWAKDQSIGYKMINARAETVGKKPAFREAFKRRRCLIPADGFYEWKRIEKRKQPYLVQMANGALFAFAGLWDRWTGPESETIESCTILTTDANELVSRLHDRMPVILSPGDYERWLDPNVKNLDGLMQLLSPFPADFMTAYPVSPELNKPASSV